MGFLPTHLALPRRVGQLLKIIFRLINERHRAFFRHKGPALRQHGDANARHFFIQCGHAALLPIHGIRSRLRFIPGIRHKIILAHRPAKLAAHDKIAFNIRMHVFEHEFLADQTIGRSLHKSALHIGQRGAGGLRHFLQRHIKIVAGAKTQAVEITSLLIIHSRSAEISHRFSNFASFIINHCRQAVKLLERIKNCHRAGKISGSRQIFAARQFPGKGRPIGAGRKQRHKRRQITNVADEVR